MPVWVIAGIYSSLCLVCKCWPSKFNLSCETVRIALESPQLPPGLDKTLVSSVTDFGDMVMEISLLSERTCKRETCL